MRVEMERLGLHHQHQLEEVQIAHKACLQVEAVEGEEIPALLDLEVLGLVIQIHLTSRV
jgi:hypothetical protein